LKIRIAGPQHVEGSLEAPTSKAYTHRALVVSLLTPGTSTIEKPLFCDDTKRTLEGVQALGAIVSGESERLKVEGRTTIPAQ